MQTGQPVQSMGMAVPLQQAGAGWLWPQQAGYGGTFAGWLWLWLWPWGYLCGQMQAQASTSLIPGLNIPYPFAGSYGLNIPDPRLAVLTKRILALAVIQPILIIVIQCITFGFQFMALIKFEDLLPLYYGVLLLVPACGYFGAKNNHGALTCLFCGGSACGSIVIIIIIVYGWVRVAQCSNVAENCRIDAVVRPCDAYDERAAQMKIRAIMWSVAGSFGFILHCSSFFFGKQLYDAIKVGQVVNSTPPQPGMAAVAVQPQAF